MRITFGSSNYLEIHLKDNQIRPLVLIAPGGGYQRTSSREAMPIVSAFIQQGYHCAVIYYRETHLLAISALDELGKAYRYLTDSQTLPIDNHKVVLLGFSSGAHYIGRLGVTYSTLGLIKPMAMILCYPVITGKLGFAHEDSIKRLYGNKNPQSRKDFSLELKVSNDTPPTFLWHTVDDKTVPVENSIFFFQALKKHEVKVDLHLFHQGLHGISLGTKDVRLDPNEDPLVFDETNNHNQAWLSLVMSFLKQISYKKD